MSNQCISWNPEEAYSNTMCMFVFVPAFLCHILFWIQVYSYKTLRHPSLIWLYNYLSLDMISLFQLLLEYLTRRSNLCGITPFWYNLLCVLEAYTNNYVTMVQSFTLILTNIYRYRLIVKRKGISIQSIRSIISIHLLIYSLPLIIFLLQYFFTSTYIIDVSGLSCSAEFSPWFIQFMNISFFAILPTCINIPFVIMVIRHVRSSQNTVRSIRRIHQYLIIQFIILYTIWLSFFLPQIIFLLSIVTFDSQSFITKLLDITATLSDVLVITLFDRRFVNAWKKSIGRILIFLRSVDRKIHPIIPQNMQLEPLR